MKHYSRSTVQRCLTYVPWFDPVAAFVSETTTSLVLLIFGAEEDPMVESIRQCGADIAFGSAQNSVAGVVLGVTEAGAGRTAGVVLLLVLTAPR